MPKIQKVDHSSAAQTDGVEGNDDAREGRHLGSLALSLPSQLAPQGRAIISDWKALGCYETAFCSGN